MYMWRQPAGGSGPLGAGGRVRQSDGERHLAGVLAGEEPVEQLLGQRRLRADESDEQQLRRHDRSHLLHRFLGH